MVIQKTTTRQFDCWFLIPNPICLGMHCAAVQWLSWISFLFVSFQFPYNYCDTSLSLYSGLSLTFWILYPVFWTILNVPIYSVCCVHSDFLLSSNFLISNFQTNFFKQIFKQMIKRITIRISDKISNFHLCLYTLLDPSGSFCLSLNSMRLLVFF